jgi:F-type H+-transporting ATPase subunit b
MNIYPNLTLVLLQFIPFLLTLVALNFLIFKPMLRYLDERDGASSGAEDEAKKIDSEIKANLEELDSTILSAQQEASAQRSTARDNLMRQYNEVVHQSRKEAEKELKEAAAEINAQQSAARQEIKAHAKDIATQIAGQALGRDIAVG